MMDPRLITEDTIYRLIKRGYGSSDRLLAHIRGNGATLSYRELRTLFKRLLRKGRIVAVARSVNASNHLANSYQASELQASQEACPGPAHGSDRSSESSEPLT